MIKASKTNKIGTRLFALICITTLLIFSLCSMAACSKHTDVESGTHGSGSEHAGAATNSPDGTGEISEEEAKQIVISRVPGSSEKDITVLQKIYDDGRCIYEGELVYDGLDYDFELDGQNGNILEWEIEDYFNVSLIRF